MTERTKQIEICVKPITNGEAINFLKDNEAMKECVFVRPCDYWRGAYYNGALVGVGGWTQKAQYAEIGGVLVQKEFRAQGIGTMINAGVIMDIGNKRVIAYARPIESEILSKFNFSKKQTLKNGTVKMERKQINE